MEYKLFTFIVFILLSSCSTRNITRDKRKVPTGIYKKITGLCREQVIESTILFNGKIKLHGDFINIKSTAEIKSAIKAQLNYLSGDLYNNSLLSKKPSVIFLKDKIKIKNIGQTNYGQDMVIDKIKHEKFEVYSDYVKKALVKNRIYKKDSAYIIEYETELDIASCLKSKESFLDLSFNYPKDPYLFYWSIAENQRQKKNWLGYSEAKVNPCATNELADFPVPEYYWYFWDRSFKNTKINCQKYLKEGNFLFEKI